MYDIQEKVANVSAGSLVLEFDGLIYKGIFPDICSLFTGSNFSIILIPTQAA
jgi:hypothetical protein